MNIKLSFLQITKARALVEYLRPRHLIIVHVNGLRLKFRDDDLFLDFVNEHSLSDVEVTIDPDGFGMYVTVQKSASEKPL